MKDVYTHAECSIAATSAENGQMGLFFIRNPFLETPFEVQLIRTAGQAVSVPPRERRYVCDVAPNKAYNHLEREPLNERAWVVQERYLSPRIMHFTRKHLYWQCNESFASERYSELPEIALRFFNDPRTVRKVIQDLRRKSLTERGRPSENDISHSEREDVYLGWCELRKMYTKCQLSHEEDRIVALLGAAEDAAEFLGGPSSKPIDLQSAFVACLWLSHITRELCWHQTANNLSELPAAPLKPRAPTWSWVSTNHVIFSNMNKDKRGPEPFSGDRYESLVELLDIQVDNQPNWICSGFLKLRCRPIPALLSKIEGVGREDKDACHRLVVVRTQHHQEFTTELSLDRPASHITEQTFFLVVLQRYMSDNAVFSHEGIGIAASVEREDVFERIGYFYIAKRQDFCVFLNEHHDELECRVITAV